MHYCDSLSDGSRARKLLTRHQLELIVGVHLGVDSATGPDSVKNEASWCN